MIRRFGLLCIIGVVACLALISLCRGADKPALDVHTFDTDPGWEKFGETAMGGFQKQVKQDFGWRPTNKAGGAAPGEIGGTFTRSLTQAVYWTPIAKKTLDDKLEISGKFAIPSTDDGSGMQIGLFNENSTGWRTSHSFVFRMSGEDKKKPAWLGNWTGKFSWVFVDVANRNWKAAGLGAFDGNVYQKTMTPPVMSDGKPHEFKVAYDPAGGGGLGEISIMIDGKTWKQTLEKDVKAEGAEFNRFGIMNLTTSGNSMEFYADDIRVNGELMDFSKDPGWQGIGNTATFTDRDARPHHDLRWSKTNMAGGNPGEIAVTMWRDERPAYYAAKTTPLTLDDELYAEGDLAFAGAGSDSGVYLGWFNAQAKQKKHTPDHEREPTSILGLAIEGPSRIGHYFRPIYSAGTEGHAEMKTTGPIIRPDGKHRHWTMHYDPRAAGGNGRITITLDQEKTEIDLKPGDRMAGATFDRFGFYEIQNGGHYVKVFLDNLKYSGGNASGQAAAEAKENLPKVVLLGDSIREHYAPFVAEMLACKANVVTPNVNGWDTGRLLQNLDAWAIREQPEVVHFNSGIHDTKRIKATDKNLVSPEQYEANLREIVHRLRTQTKAKIIFALSTPIIDERTTKLWETRSYRLIAASIVEYNGIAKRVMDELGVPVNDLPAALGDAAEYTRLHDEQGVHFTKEGSEKLAKAVTSQVSKYLPEKVGSNGGS